MARQTVIDEPGPSTGEDTEAGFVKGYESTDPENTNTPETPGWQDYGSPGEAAVAYKAVWKNRPRTFPTGSGGGPG